MRILAKDLQLHLNRGLGNFYFIFGEEPQQHQEALETLRQAAMNQGFTEGKKLSSGHRNTWEDLRQDCNSQSLFSNKRVLEYTITEEKINKDSIEILDKLGSFQIPIDLIIVVIAHKIDYKQQQAKWFSQLEQKGISILARALTREETLQWIQKRLISIGYTATYEAMHLLWEHTEANLLATAQFIEKLALYKCHDASIENHDKQPHPINIEDIQAVSDMDPRFSLYDLIDAALLGNVKRTSQIFYCLKSERIDPILINWAIAKEVRTSILLSHKMQHGASLSNLFTEHGVWKRREPLIKGFIQRTSLDKLQQILLKAKNLDEIIKGHAIGNAWDTLLTLCLMLTGEHYA